MSDEQQDDQQHQQNMFDALLVPIDEQVKIRLSNFRIALEKSQPDVIYQSENVNFDDSSGKTLGSRLILKNPGAKDPEFGMAILMVMQNDDINTFADYLEYLAKSLETQPVEVKGHETSQSEEVANTVDSEETKEEDEIPLVQRQTKVIIGRRVHQESDEEALDHFKKLKGVERMSETTKYLLEMKQAQKSKQTRLHSSTMTKRLMLRICSSNSSSLKSKIENISSDDENDGAKDKENAEEEKGEEDQHMDDVGGNEQVGDTQAKFINDNPDVSLTDVLKEPVEAKVQSLVDVPVLQQNVAEQRPPLVDTTVTLIPETTHSPKQPPQTQPKRSKTKRILKKSTRPETQVDIDVLDD
ncbi:hypothetical protein Tco_1411135 [Tanacetum coccineum]